MPPKRGKKGKRRGDDSSDDDAAAFPPTSSAKSRLTDSTLEDPVVSNGKASQEAVAQPTKTSRKSKKKGKAKGRGNVDSDSDDVDALDPLAHLRGGGRKIALLEDSDEDKPKKPLTKKEKRLLEEERRREREVEMKKASEDAEHHDIGSNDDEIGGSVDAIQTSDADEEMEVGASSAKSQMAKKGKKGMKGERGDDEDESDAEKDAHEGGTGDGERRKKPPTKKERRRMEEQERRQRELQQEERAGATTTQEEVMGQEADDHSDDGHGDDGVHVGDDEVFDGRSSSSKKGKNDKKNRAKNKNKRAGDTEENNRNNDESEKELRRGMDSLTVVDGGDSSPQKKMSKKERRRAEAAALAAGHPEHEGDMMDVDEDEGQRDKGLESNGGGDGRSRESTTFTTKTKDEGENEGEEAEEGADGRRQEVEGGKDAKNDDEDDGKKRRMSKKERKKAKQGSKKKGVSDSDTAREVTQDNEEVTSRDVIVDVEPEEAMPSASDDPDVAVGGRDAQDVVPVDGMDDVRGTKVEGLESRDAVSTKSSDAPSPVTDASKAAGATPSPPPPLPPPDENTTTKKKPKKSKLMRKLEDAARLKAEAEASAGVTGAETVSAVAEKERLEAEQAEQRRKEDKAARKSKKEAARAKESKVKSILEDLDEVEYYGSDHEERALSKNKGKKQETVEEELARLVDQAQSSGKTLTGRQRKKILQDVEARRRAAADEAREELAHRDGAQFGCSQTAVSAGDQQWANSLDITIEAFSISAHDKTLFKDSPLQVVHGRKYGLVGPNGAGKSTLLKMIASGELKIPPKIDCLYVEQEVVADDTPAVIAVMKADKARWSLMEEERKINRSLKDDPEDDKLNDRLQQIHEELHSSGGDDAEATARRILFGLGFDEVMQVKATKNFSGGWRMRISLARALFMAPTLMMLDEPTNHLDLNAVIWLDDYLQKWKKTLLVVSHDQDFLNSVCEEILHLDSKRINNYKGNYDQFKEMEAQKRRQQAKEWDKQQRRLAMLKKGGQSKGKAEETIKKSKFREPGGSKKKKNDAVASGTGEVETVKLVERPRDYVVTLNFPEVSTLSPPVIEVMDVDFKYETGPTILKNVNFGLDQQSRICIVGPNGAGKTTLLKLLTGALEPTKGFLRRNPRMRAGIYNQHFVDRLPMDIDPTSYLKAKFSDQCDYQTARNLLGRFGLEGHAHTIKMRDLSGGQKARVVFCELSLQAPHVLFLDEPTNNLDIESIDALCTALTEFNGGVVVVTHDARLIEATECRLWIVDEQEVTPWEGEFEDYREDLLRQLEEKLAAQEQARADTSAISS